MNNAKPKIYNLGILEEKTYSFALRIKMNMCCPNNFYVQGRQLVPIAGKRHTHKVNKISSVN